MSFYTDYPLYPTEVFDDTDYPNQTDNTDTVYAKLINALKEELQAVMAELGTLPKGAHASVKARLEAIEAQLKLELDYMEYVSNALAQLAYVTNGGVGSDLVINGGFSSDVSGWTPFNSAVLSSVAGGQSGNCLKVARSGHAYPQARQSIAVIPGMKYTLTYYFKHGNSSGGGLVSIGSTQGASDYYYSYTAEGGYLTDASWTSYSTGEFTATGDTLYLTFWSFNNAADGTYDLYDTITCKVSKSLQCFSESTIKQQGSYSLKVGAVKTDSLNKTLTKTVSPLKDLTGKPKITLWAYSNRTGSNFKVEFHDSGGNTISYTVNILIAATWEKKEIDISAVSDANKDSIDQYKYTILNADAIAIFYLDNNFST